MTEPVTIRIKTRSRAPYLIAWIKRSPAGDVLAYGRAGYAWKPSTMFERLRTLRRNAARRPGEYFYAYAGAAIRDGAAEFTIKPLESAR